jgi:hypothetical protein
MHKKYTWLLFVLSALTSSCGNNTVAEYQNSLSENEWNAQEDFLRQTRENGWETCTKKWHDEVAEYCYQKHGATDQSRICTLSIFKGNGCYIR